MIKKYRKQLTVTASLMYIIFSLLYILAGVLDMPFFRIFKIFPLVILIILRSNHYQNRNILQLILALLFGSAGDLVL